MTDVKFDREMNRTLLRRMKRTWVQDTMEMIAFVVLCLPFAGLALGLALRMFMWASGF